MKVRLLHELETDQLELVGPLCILIVAFLGLFSLVKLVDKEQLWPKLLTFEPISNVSLSYL